MSPRDAERRARQPAAAEIESPPKTLIGTDASSGGRQFALVVGEWLAPAGRRTMPAVLVRSCPNCGGAHLHRGGRNGALTTRVGSCGAAYAILVAAAEHRGAA